jgi:nucleotide-binding universal stress UspA family protein
MEEPPSDGDVMVAVEDPDQVAQLVRTAGALARDAGRTVRLVTVVVKPHESPFGLFTDETIIEEFAADSQELLAEAPDPEGVEVLRDLVVARSVADGLVTAVKREQPASLVIGWDTDPRATDVLLGSTVDEVFERAPTDVYVERIGREANGVESVLLPVAGGPHATAARTAAVAIARANDATITILSIAADGPDERAAHEIVSEESTAIAAALSEEQVDTVVTSADRVEDEIVSRAPAHDVILLGATRKGVLRGRLVGSVPRRVVDESDGTVIVARSAAGRLGRLERWVASITGHTR